RATFTIYDVVKTIFLIGSKEIIGRKVLSKELGVGEGGKRNVLSRLERRGIIRSSRRGHYLTDYGMRIYSKLKTTISLFDNVKFKSMRVWRTCSGVLIKGKADKISSGLEQREVAVREGACGAITVVCRDNKLIFPGSGEFREYKRFLEEIREIFKPEDGDVIIIAGGNTVREARTGAVSAAFTLI
ncbi:hypothetical protein DRN86_05405, partial [Candidatus Geothermarchaeota archaeon]